jgi:prolipoprotein diacylglyceryl transferase
LYLYSRRKPDQPFLWVVDRVVIIVSLGGMLIRLGNLLNSEIYGLPTSLPWGFLFVRETDPTLLPVVPRHPTQLYEALFCLFLLALTFYLWRNKRNVMPPGIITGLFIFLLFSFRFLVEFLKNDQSGFEQGMVLNMGQLLSIPAILVGLLVLRYARRNAYRLRMRSAPEA